MNTNFFVAEDEVFNPNKVLTRKEMDAFIGDRGIKSYAGVLKKDNKLFYNFIRVKVAEGKNCVDAIYARKAIVSNGCLRNDFFYFGGYTNGCTGYFPTEEEFDMGGYEVYWSMLFYFMYHGRVFPLQRNSASELIRFVADHALGRNSDR